MLNSHQLKLFNGISRTFIFLWKVPESVLQKWVSHSDTSANELTIYCPRCPERRWNSIVSRAQEFLQTISSWKMLENPAVFWRISQFFGPGLHGICRLTSHSHGVCPSHWHMSTDPIREVTTAASQWLRTTASPNRARRGGSALVDDLWPWRFVNDPISIYIYGIFIVYYVLYNVRPPR